MNELTKISPIFIPLICSLAGVYIQENCPVPQPILVLCILLGIIFFIFANKQKSLNFSKIGVAIIVLSSGSLLLILQKNEYFYFKKFLQEKTVTIIGIIKNKELWGDSSSGDALFINVSEIFIPSTKSFQQLHCTILCFCKYHTSVQVGDTVLIKDVIVQNQNKEADEQTTFHDYLLKEGIFGSSFIANSHQIKMIARPSWSFQRILWNLRSRIYNTLTKKLSLQTSNYFGLIFLGNKQQDSLQDLRKIFNYWGLSHYLARSGLHIVLFIMIWSLLLRLIPIHLYIKKIILLCICISYDLISWTSVPFIRAYYAFLFVSLGSLLNKHIHYPHILSLICFYMILYNPMQLFFLDFQLNFALTFITIFLSKLWQDKK